MDFLSYSLVTPRGAFTSKNTEKKRRTALFLFTTPNQKRHIVPFLITPQMGFVPNHFYGENKAQSCYLLGILF